MSFSSFTLDGATCTLSVMCVLLVQQSRKFLHNKRHEQDAESRSRECCEFLLVQNYGKIMSTITWIHIQSSTSQFTRVICGRVAAIRPYSTKEPSDPEGDIVHLDDPGFISIPEYPTRDNEPLETRRQRFAIHSPISCACCRCNNWHISICVDCCTRVENVVCWKTTCS